MRKTDIGFLTTTLTLSDLQVVAWLSWQQHHCRSAIPYETPISPLARTGFGLHNTVGYPLIKNRKKLSKLQYRARIIDSDCITRSQEHMFVSCSFFRTRLNFWQSGYMYFLKMSSSIGWYSNLPSTMTTALNPTASFDYCRTSIHLRNVNFDNYQKSLYHSQ
jgi:hypothetical protein